MSCFVDSEDTGEEHSLVRWILFDLSKRHTSFPIHCQENTLRFSWDFKALALSFGNFPVSAVRLVHCSGHDLPMSLEGVVLKGVSLYHRLPGAGYRALLNSPVSQLNRRNLRGSPGSGSSVMGSHTSLLCMTRQRVPKSLLSAECPTRGNPFFWMSSSNSLMAGPLLEMSPPKKKTPVRWTEVIISHPPRNGAFVRSGAFLVDFITLL